MEKIQKLFRKYQIWPFILTVSFTTIMLYDIWRMYYQIFATEIDYKFYTTAGSFLIFGGICLLCLLLYLRYSENPGFYNKSSAISLLIGVPFVIGALLLQKEIFIPENILLSAYILFIIVMFILYIQNYNNLYPVDPLIDRTFFENSLKVEIIYLIVAFGFILIALSLDLLLLILYGGAFGFINKKFVYDKGKKTYLDVIGKKPIFTFIMVILFNLISRTDNKYIYGTLIYLTFVAIYFLFLRKIIVSKSKS